MCMHANGTIVITVDMKTWSVKFGDVAAYTTRTNGAHSIERPTLQGFYDGFQDYLVDAHTPFCDVVAILVALAIEEGRVDSRLFDDLHFRNHALRGRSYADLTIEGGEDFVVALPVAVTCTPLECACTLATWRAFATAPGSARPATQFHGPELYGDLPKISGPTFGDEFQRARQLQRARCKARSITLREQMQTLLRKYGVRFFTPHMMRTGFVGACLPWRWLLLICGKLIWLPHV